MALPAKPPGRPKGVPNKLGTRVRDAIEWAFENAGGGQYLLKIAQEDPKTFAVLLGKVLPTQIEGNITGIVVTIAAEASEL